MPLTLDTPEALNKTVAKFEITSFAVDIERGELVIGYDQVDDADNKLNMEKVLVVDGPDFVPAIARVSAIVGGDVYAALKQGMYEEIQAATGATGTIV